MVMNMERIPFSVRCKGSSHADLNRLSFELQVQPNQTKPKHSDLGSRWSMKNWLRGQHEDDDDVDQGASSSSSCCRMTFVLDRQKRPSLTALVSPTRQLSFSINALPLHLDGTFSGIRPHNLITFYLFSLCFPKTDRARMNSNKSRGHQSSLIFQSIFFACVRLPAIVLTTIWQLDLR